MNTSRASRLLSLTLALGITMSLLFGIDALATFDAPPPAIAAQTPQTGA